MTSASDKEPGWAKALEQYPFAAALLATWREHAGELHDGYAAALEAALAGFDEERELDERYQCLIGSRAQLTLLLKGGECDDHLAAHLLLIRVHRALGERGTAGELTANLLGRLSAAEQSLALNWPFLPPIERFDRCPPGADPEGWVEAALLDTQLELGRASRYQDPGSYLARLARRRKLPCVSIEGERMLALAALRLGKNMTVKPGARLVTETLNAPLWNTLCRAVDAEATRVTAQSTKKRPAVIREPDKLESRRLGAKLCVGVPVYNEEKYIAETIRSLKTQDFDEVRFLMSDNASTDRTLEIILDETSGDKRFEVFQQQRNVGAGGNFVFVFEHSESEFFMWLGAHDFLSPGYLKAVMNSIQGEPELSMVCGYPYAVLNDRRSTSPVRVALYDFGQDDPIQRYIQSVARLGNCTIFHSVFPRKFLQDAEFRSTISADHVLISRLLWFGKLKQLPDVRYYRRYFNTRNETQDERISGESGTKLERRDFYQYYLDDFARLYHHGAYQLKQPLAVFQRHIQDLLTRRWEASAQPEQASK
jgi:glycosyltransferase involved in cell wall biosynthesis